jgi:hypothetical protein
MLLASSDSDHELIHVSFTLALSNSWWRIMALSPDYTNCRQM